MSKGKPAGKTKKQGGTLSGANCIGVFDQWLKKDQTYYWEQNALVVRDTLLDHIESGFIPFNLAQDILRSARTAKCPSHANAGMAWIEQEWLRLREDELDLPGYS